MRPAHHRVPQNNDFLSQLEIFDDFEKNIAIINQLDKLKLHLKEAEIAVLKEKINRKSDVISESEKTEQTKVNSLLGDIRLAISNAKEDISKNDSKKIKTSLKEISVEGSRAWVGMSRAWVGSGPG